MTFHQQNDSSLICAQRLRLTQETTPIAHHHVICDSELVEPLTVSRATVASWRIELCRSGKLSTVPKSRWHCGSFSENLDRKLTIVKLGLGKIMTTRSSRATITGLRRLVRERDVPPKVRLRAIEMLCELEGLFDSNGKLRQSTLQPINLNRFRRLLEAGEARSATA